MPYTIAQVAAFVEAEYWARRDVIASDIVAGTFIHSEPYRLDGRIDTTDCEPWSADCHELDADLIHSIRIEEDGLQGWGKYTHVIYIEWRHLIYGSDIDCIGYAMVRIEKGDRAQVARSGGALCRR